MLLDARSLTDGQSVDADICIVGAGPAGISLALEFAGSDLKVLLLESGSDKWTLRGKLLTRGENVDPNYYRLEWTRLRTFGGSSWAWSAHGLRTRPFEELDFIDRPEIARPGWPIASEELAPYWPAATSLCHLPSVGYGVENWETADTPAIRGGADLDTSMFPLGPGDAFTGRLEQLRHIRNVTCMLNATVLELHTNDSGGRVEQASVALSGGRRCYARAKSFVLALGGIENARMLLLSRRAHRHGIGNGHDLVGRYFMEHPHIRTGVLRPSPAPRASTFALYRRVEGPQGAAIGFLRPSDAALRREHLLGSAWAFHPSTPALTSDTGRALTDVKESVRCMRLLPQTGTRLSVLARSPGRVVSTVVRSRDVRRGEVPAEEFRLLGMTEQEPNRDSRVVLGSGKDRLGQPVARLDWRLTERDLWSVRRTQDVLSDALERAGVGRIVQRFGDVQPPPLIGGGYHHMGTTRMGRDPREGVVDTDCCVHGTGNLYIAGSSVFPTSGFANPTLTLVALTLRLARHLRSQFGIAPPSVSSPPTGTLEGL
jgi:choline dehydrogenase-like flavoprotein